MLQFVAVLAASLFAGAALYINVAEQPARLLLDNGNALRQWAPSYRRATLLQAPLAVISFLAGTALWLTDARAIWLLPALLIGANVPYTLLILMKTNRRLLSEGLNRDSEEVRTLLEHWGRLHAVRTTLSIGAASLYSALIISG